VLNTHAITNSEINMKATCNLDFQGTWSIDAAVSRFSGEISVGSTENKVFEFKTEDK
jgi:hypothetical protein